MATIIDASQMTEAQRLKTSKSSKQLRYQEEGTEITEEDLPESIKLTYSIYDKPPWLISFMLGFQHYLMMFGSTLLVPMLVSTHCCAIAINDYQFQSRLICTVFFVSGICTLIQSTLGVRLPIIQGGTFSFLVPAAAILSAAPYGPCMTLKDLDTTNLTNETLEMKRREIAEQPFERIRELQGACIAASLFEMALGFFGVINLLLKVIGPLTVTVVIATMTLGLFEVCVEGMAAHWGISILTASVLTISSQYLKRFECRLVCTKQDSGFHKHKYPIFSMFPVVIAIIFASILCIILTVTDVFPKQGSGSAARVDSRLDVITKTAVFVFPYPFQWGLPKFSLGACIGMMASVISSIIESIGDYYACAKMAGAPPPPRHAINRGIMFEGIGCMAAALFGTGNGTTSYSENIGAIGLTKVGSRRVIQMGAVVMLVVGVLGKFCAVFVVIPEPIMGGVLLVVFGYLLAVAISNLQHVNLNSARNLFVLGVPTMAGIVVPHWVKKNPGSIETGSTLVDQLLSILLGTSMVVGGVLAVLLDNTIAGNDDERGIRSWKGAESGEHSKDLSVYEMPGLPGTCGQALGRNSVWQKLKAIMPICPPRVAETTEL